ncbi:MAG: DUF6176 family protein [Candidatus Omnitrophota bacterium]
MNWTLELKSRKREVLNSLRREGVLSEACFISKDGNYIYYFMEADDFDKINKIFMNSRKKIDIKHKEITKKSLEFIEKLDELFYFSIKK